MRVSWADDTACFLRELKAVRALDVGGCGTQHGRGRCHWRAGEHDSLFAAALLRTLCGSSSCRRSSTNARSASSKPATSRSRASSSQLHERSGVDPELERSGLLRVASSEEAARALRSQCSALQASGAEVAWLAASAARAA